MPSKLAAAILYMAREKVGLIPWTLQLQELTQYGYEDIRPELLALAKLVLFLCQKNRIYLLFFFNFSDKYIGCNVCLHSESVNNKKRKRCFI